jgi:hypothetical protein
MIVMATGYVSDPLFFLSGKSARLSEVRAEFLERLKDTNPQFVVVTNEQWPVYEQNGYEKLNNWPEFEDFLKQDYVMSIERGGNQEHERGYRIYIRKGNDSLGALLVQSSDVRISAKLKRPQ